MVDHMAAVAAQMAENKDLVHIAETVVVVDHIVVDCKLVVDIPCPYFVSWWGKINAPPKFSQNRNGSTAHKIFHTRNALDRIHFGLYSHSSSLYRIVPYSTSVFDKCCKRCPILL